jgi:hypothetical protein
MAPQGKPRVALGCIVVAIDERGANSDYFAYWIRGVGFGGT